MKQTTFPWSELRRDIPRPEGSPINRLIDHIVISGISEFLHAATMHSNLRIGRSEDFSTEDGELQITYDENLDEVQFCYFDSDREDPWCKACEGSEIIPTFTHVITKRLRWIKP